jgi:hypothetical protein
MFQLIPLYLFTTAVIAVLVQSFLVVRYWWLWVLPLFQRPFSQKYQPSTRNILVTLVIFFLILVAVRRSLSSCTSLHAHCLRYTVRRLNRMRRDNRHGPSILGAQEGPDTSNVRASS